MRGTLDWGSERRNNVAENYLYRMPRPIREADGY